MIRNGLKDRSLLPLRCCKTYVEAGDRVDLAIGQMLSEGQRLHYHETMMLRTGTTVMYCPRVTCGVLIILDGLLSSEAVKATRHGFQADLELGDSHQMLNVGPVGCPKCEQALCFCCRSEWHQGMTCKQYQFTVSRMADDITKFCRQMNWMRFFECGHVIEKKAGCNHIMCLCGAQFCYLCGSKWGSCQCQIISAGHALRHHRMLEVEASRCPHCQQAFPSEAELRVHMGLCQAAAAQNGVYTCNNCTRRFRDYAEYREHRRNCFEIEVLRRA